jgi:predicted transposase YbfD/YdcC
MTEKEFTTVFNEFTQDINDPRINRKKLHTLQEVFFVVFIGELTGSDGWKEFEEFAKEKIKLFRKFYPYVNGIPSDDTLRRLFRRLGFKYFQKMFKKWLESLQIPQELSIAIDGKVSKGTKTANGSHLHTVSAFSTENHLVLAQEKTNEKSNEITAIPKLIQTLDLKKGTTVTIDAIGCQREICISIIEKEADYCIAVKDNQPTLFREIKDIFTLSVSEIKTDSSKNEGHGRKEERIVRSIDAPENLKKNHNWPGLTSIIEVTSRRIIKKETTECKRYYVSSLKANAKKQAKIIRSHWSIENNLHWVLDVAFKDDGSRIQKGNAPENLAVVKHFCFNLLKMAQPKNVSIRRLRKMASYSDERLLEILAHIKRF